MEKRGGIVSEIDYNSLVQNALKSVVRQVLEDAARNGLPGEHHFYIAFDTRAAGVEIAPRLKEKYPEDMTVVLQNKYWDLEVAPDHFAVTLTFGGVPERLVIPFSAVIGFVDPSVQFALQFETGENEDEIDLDEEESVSDEENAAEPVPPGAPKKSASGENGDSNVVTLDRFRKK